MFSLFKSKSKGKHTAPSSSSNQRTTPTSSPSFLALALPSTSLIDDSQATPSGLRRGDESSSVKSSVESSPWVKVDEGDEEDGPKGRKEREAKEKAKLERAVLGVAEATVLMEECGAVIRDYGLTTVGLFRPYRLAESQASVRKLSLMFLTYANDHSQPAGSDSVAKDLFGAGSKQAKLAKFRDELRYAGVHDVVGVLKWGLRHLHFSTPFGGPSSAAPSSSLAWYHNFLLSSAESYHSTSAFPLQLLPSLPPSSATFLQATLNVLQSVAAHAEQNAMPSRKLCRTLGLYVFGLAPRDKSWNGDAGWEALYEQWQQAGDALEGCLRAHLRSQTSLPPRLMDLIEGYPGPSPSSMAGGKDSAGKQRRVLRVELESKGEWDEAGSEGVNSQQTGRVEGRGQGGVWARREPLEVLLAAFEASEGGEEVVGDEAAPRRAWSIVVSTGKEAPREVLSEETVRVLELVGLNKLPGEAQDEDAPKAFSLSPTTPTRSHGRSFSLSSPSRDGLAPLSEEGDDFTPAASRHPNGFSTLSPTNFPNKSVGNLLSSPHRQHPPKRIVTPTWTEFASSGFSTSDDIGLVSPGSDEFPSRGEGRARDLTPAARKRVKPTTTLVSVSWWTLEDEFVDVWLDTLVEQRGACEGWPSLVVAEMRPEVVQKLAEVATGEVKVDHLLVAERLVPLVSPPPATALARRDSQARHKAASISESTRSRKWSRRASGLFSASTTNLNPPSTNTSPRKSRQSAIPPVPSFPSASAVPSTSTSITALNGPPAALGGLVSRTMLRRKSDKGGTRPFSSFEVVPPVPSLPTPAPAQREVMPTSVPMVPSSSGTSTRGSTASREKKISRVAVPVFDPEAEALKSRVDLGQEQEKEVVKDEVALPVNEAPNSTLAPSTSIAAVAAIEPLAAQLETPVVEKEDPSAFATEVQPESPIAHAATSLLAGLAAVPALGAAAVAAFKRGVAEEEQRADEGDVSATEKSGQASTTIGKLSMPLVADENFSAPSHTTSAVPPAVEVNVEQMEQAEPLSDLVGTASQIEVAIADPEYNSEAIKEPEAAIAEQDASASADEAHLTPPKTFDAAVRDDDLDIAQFVMQDDAIAAAEGSAAPSPVFASAPRQITPPPESTPILEIKNPVDSSVVLPVEIPATSSVPDAPAIEALLTSPIVSAATTPLDEHAEPTPVLSASVESTAEVVEELKNVEAEREPALVASPTFSLSPPAGEPMALPAEEPRFSQDTLRGPPDVDDAVPTIETTSAPLESPMDPLQSSPTSPLADLAVTDEAPTAPILAPFITPIKTAVATPSSPTLSPDADLSRTLSQGSQLSVPTSPTPSNGSSSSTGKKILGSMGGFLRRKKSAVELEKARQLKEDKATEKEEMKQLKKLKEEEKKREAKERKAPTPVSSVKKRVLEIEAETAELEGQPASPTTASKRLSSYPSNSSLNSKARPLSLFALPTSPSQEPVHHHAKEPAALDELPSALPTPSPASPVGEAPLLLSDADDPFLVDSNPSSPPAAPVFALSRPADLAGDPIASSPAADVVDASDGSSAEPLTHSTVAALGTSTMPATPALESAEEGHSAFAEPEVDEPNLPAPTPALEAAEEGFASPVSAATEVEGEGVREFEAYPLGEQAAVEVGNDARDEEAAEVPVPTEHVNGTSEEIPSPVKDVLRPSTPTATADEASSRAAPSTPPRQVDDLPPLDSLSTPRKPTSPLNSTPRKQGDEPATALGLEQDTQATPVKSAEPASSSSTPPALRTQASQDSMATSFRTAASEASSASTSATEGRPWEEAPMEI